MNTKSISNLDKMQYLKAGMAAMKANHLKSSAENYWRDRLRSFASNG